MALEILPRPVSLLSTARAPKPQPIEIPEHYEAGSRPFPEMVRYKNLERCLRGWVWRHRIPSLRAQATRAFLCSGEPSTGKSKSLVNYLCAEENMHVISIGAHQLTSSFESENVEAADRLLAGAEALASGGTDVVIEISDAEAIWGLAERISQTSNPEYMRVWFMHLADNPRRYMQGDRQRPILFAFSCNGGSSHAATWRSGRVTAYAHSVSATERAEIIAHHLRPQTLLERRIVSILRRKYGSKAPLAFFGELSAAIDTARIDALLEVRADIATIEQELAKPRSLNRETLRLAAMLWAGQQASFNPRSQGE